MTWAPGVALLGAWMALPAGATETASGYYRGAIEAGRRRLDVGLEMVVEGSAVSGSCFYVRTKGADIPITGAVGPDGAIRFEEKGEGGKATGVWSGRVSSGAFSGTWENPTTGQRWPFQLSRQDARGRYVGEPVSLKSASSLGPLTYRMAEAPVSAKQVPQVTDFAERRVVNAVNRNLMSVARAATCGHEPDDYELSAEVAYAGEDVLSVRVRASWFCGAAYPTTDADQSMTFDLRTGDPVEMSSLFRDGVAGATLDGILFAHELSQVLPRMKEYCAKEADLLDDKKLLEEEACAEAFATSIDENDQDYCLLQYTPRHLAESGATFHFSPEGLVVRPDWPHVIAGCAREITVPYRALAPLAAPGKALARVAAAHADAPLRYRIHRAGARPEEDEFYTPPAR
jgi:hypothetical protein